MLLLMYVVSVVVPVFYQENVIVNKELLIVQVLAVVMLVTMNVVYVMDQVYFLELVIVMVTQLTVMVSVVEQDNSIFVEFVMDLD